MRWRVLAFAIVLAAPVAAQQPRIVEQVSGVKSVLEAVSPVNDRVVWASGGGGTVLLTVDGGDTWTRRPIPGAERLDFRGIHAISAKEAWALSIGNGPASRIYHTADSGATWTEQFKNSDSTAFFDCITFFDAKHGAVFGDASNSGTSILRTEDGGEHWTLLGPGDAPTALPKEGGFASSNSCILSVDGSHGFIGASTPGARIFRTDNAGKSWSLAGLVPVIHDAQSGTTALSFRDTKHGIAVAGHVAGNMTRDSTPNAVATTDDGGATWTLRHRPEQAGMLSGVALVPGVNDKTVVTATYTGIFFTTDLADHWTSVASGYYWAVRAFGKRVWAVGRGGVITRLEF